MTVPTNGPRGVIETPSSLDDFQIDDTPVLRLEQGERTLLVEAIDAHFAMCRNLTLYQQAGRIVHVADRLARRADGTIETDKAIVGADVPRVVEEFAKRFRIERFDRRSRRWEPIDPPAAVAAEYMSRSSWSLPVLRQIVAGPTLTADDCLIDTAGFYERNGLFLISTVDGLSIPVRPTRQDAERANEVLVGIFESFPFVSEPAGESLAVAMAGLLTAVLRPTLATAPVFAITATAAGTGKSYLVDVLAKIATGRRALAIATGGTPEEFEKSLGAAMIEGRTLVNLDNLVTWLGGQLLCMLGSQDRVSLRLLGQSKSIDVPVSAAIFATGNGLRVHGDLTRRTLLCRLDARMERPEERVFDADLIAEADRRRAELLSAVLMIARWGLQRDPAPLPVRQLAGFDDWCRRVRDPLVALGHADPVGSIDLVRQTDAEAERLVTLMAAWSAAFGSDAYTTGGVIDRATMTTASGDLVNSELASALAAVTGSRPQSISPHRLGNYLSRIQGRIIGGRHFDRHSVRSNAVRWFLVEEAQP